MSCRAAAQEAAISDDVELERTCDTHRQHGPFAIDS